jgi:hypothetical protein
MINSEVAQTVYLVVIYLDELFETCTYINACQPLRTSAAQLAARGPLVDNP